MEGIKGERSEHSQSDRAEKHDQTVLDVGCFEVQKVIFFHKNALDRSPKLCFLCGRGAHFYKKGESDGRKMKMGSEKRSMASLMPI